MSRGLTLMSRVLFLSVLQMWHDFNVLHEVVDNILCFELHVASLNTLMQC